MRNQFPFLGIYSPRLYAILRELPMPPPDQAIELAAACWNLAEREYQYAGVWHLRRVARGLPGDCLPAVQLLIVTKSWWDTVDALATDVVGALVLAHAELTGEMDRWIEADNIWLVRTAILHQERWKTRTDPARLFAYCRRRAEDREFFIRKAIGWALRSYAAVDPRAVAHFVEANEGALSGLSRREAVRGVTRHLH